MIPIQQIVHEYRKDLGEDGKPMAYRPFAEQLSEPLAVMQRKISHASVQNWETERYEPNDDDLHLLVICAKPHTWQWHFACDLRAAKYPTIYQPVGEIGKRILMVEGEHVPASN